MTTISYQNEDIPLVAGQDVLSALLDRGKAIPHSCRAGVCQSCMMEVLEGEVPAAAQTGLRDTQKAQGRFLACLCKPTKPLRIALPAESLKRTVVEVVAQYLLNKDVLCLRLRPQEPFAYHAGQYLTLWTEAEQGRCYSLASVPELDDFLEFHIRCLPNGVVSGQLCRQTQPGSKLRVHQPTGESFYVPGNPAQPLLLVGTGTGLAPLYGIARDALHQQHRGDIHLVHGSPSPEGLYLHQTLQELAASHANFHYHPSVLDARGASGYEEMPVDALALSLLVEPAAWKIYLCGVPELVNPLRRKIFMAGAASRNIYVDPFVSAPAA